MLSSKDSTFLHCATMILHDQCPPDVNHYLCMKEEDDNIHDCTQCWHNYLWCLEFCPDDNSHLKKH